MKLNVLKHPGVITIITLLFISVFAYLPSRKNKNSKAVDSYAKFISAYTGGEISRKSPITIRFVDEVVKLGDLSSSYQHSVLSFSPNASGEFKWIDTRTLQFNPAYGFMENEVYEATVDLKKLIPNIPDSLSAFQFKFKTRKNSIRVDIKNPTAMDLENPHWQKIEGIVKTSDYERFYRIKEAFEASFNGNSRDIKWYNSLDGTEFRFLIDSLLRKNKTSNIVIYWNKYEDDTLISGQKMIRLEPLDNFALINTESHTYPEQSLMLEFTDPLKVNQDLEGLIRIPDIEFRSVIDNNKILIYPKKRISGNIQLTVEAGISNNKGMHTRKKVSKDFTFEEPYPQLKEVRQGTILPQSDILPFTFEAINLSAVDIRIIKITENNIPQFLQINNLSGAEELKRVGTFIVSKKIKLNQNKGLDLKSWNKHTIDLSKIFRTEPGAIYQVAIGFKKSYSLFSCTDTSDTSYDGERDMLKMSATWDQPGYEYDENYWSYYYGNSYTPCEHEYYSADKAIIKNILASNIGLIAKKGSEGKMLAAANDLLSTAPLSGVKLELYDYQQQLISSSVTENGIANLNADRKPFLLVASHGKQRGYLKVDNNNSLSLSKFNIEGNKYIKGIKGFIYGERDVWRPGDSLFLNFVLEDLQNSLPPGHPVVFELYDPQLEMVQRIVKTSSLNNIYTFHTKTDDEAKTGSYTAKVIVGGSTYEQTIKIESIIPNRLKIELKLNKDSFHPSDKEIKGTLSARWLHGSIAKNMKADVSMILSESHAQFDKYKAYNFNNPYKKFQSEKKEIFKGTIDENGKAEIKAHLETNTIGAGVLHATFKTKVFEPGGSFSTDYFSTTVYPFETYAGIHIPKTEQNQILFTNRDNQIDIVTINSSGSPVSDKKVIMQLYKTSWRWWWESSDNDDFSYNGKLFSEPILTDTLITINGHTRWKLNLDAPEWGRYFIKAIAEGGHSSGQIIYFESQGWTDRKSSDNPEGTKMLNFSTNKDIYTVGENVTLSIPSPYAGSALLSLESGTQVLKTYWVKAKKGITHYTFPAESMMAPNVYAHITMIQPHGQTSNDLPVRMYGILPIKVINPLTQLHPVISIPEKLKPEQEVNIKIREHNNLPMTYTIAIVDEGLLDLTRYKTPDIWTAFNQKQALDVRTWDMYNEVISADALHYRNIISIGGDGSNGPLDAAKANRFKPVVMFLGPFHCHKGEIKNHKVKLPNYIGSVKTMVIAAYEGTYGSSEAKSEVSKPLMLLGTLPRVFSPNEETSFPISIFSKDASLKIVNLEIKTNELINASRSSVSMSFTSPGEQLVYLPLKISNETGVAKIKVLAKSGKETAEYTAEINVRSPNPFVEQPWEKVLHPGQSWKLGSSPIGTKGTNEGIFEISSMPPLNLHTRLDYLIHYPYGCLEQTTSSVFPQLSLHKLTDLTKEQNKEIEQNIRAAIQRLKKFQLTDGSLSYWPGQNKTNNWGTCYAGHFMLEAEKSGYTLPLNFKTKWTKYISETVKNNPDNFDEEIQAYRIYLLALCKSPEIGPMNRMRINAPKSPIAKCFLYSAYYLSGQKELAVQMLKGIDLNVIRTKEHSYTYGSDIRDKAIMLYTLNQINDTKSTNTLASDIASILSSKQDLNTQETSYCLLALANYKEKNRQDGMARFMYTHSGYTEKIISNNLIWQRRFKNDDNIGLEINNSGERNLYINYTSKGIPSENKPIEYAANIKMDIQYQTMDGKPINISNVTQGTDFIARISVENTGTKGNYENIALSAAFPSGWEIHNKRMYHPGLNGSASYTYQDIRDDRVNIFFDLKAKETKTFTVMLNASYEGRYYLPSVYVEAMYDHSIRALKAGKWIQVTKNNSIQ
ncbi:MAG: hypothetical protein J7604_04920 [Sporocytophaga sp.]|uniref:alpha-2-macroglobulin family protein n=1 Tax=Sporocytophaga sp. TaxID=2231183 RepID=UPI001B043B17|nr:MG2 domain-containing protein [Sporocytophaga sp.]MBO9699529.1 hypothetical protein [Sporocytophaga sp.]